MFRRDRKIKNTEEPSPPVSPMKEFGPRPAPDDETSAQESLRSTPPAPKEFGPQKNRFSLFQTTQEELVRIAMEKKRASSRLQQAFVQRASLLASERASLVDPGYHFAMVFEEEGNFVIECIQ